MLSSARIAMATRVSIVARADVREQEGVGQVLEALVEFRLVAEDVEACGGDVA